MQINIQTKENQKNSTKFQNDITFHAKIHVKVFVFCCCLNDDVCVTSRTKQYSDIFLNGLLYFIIKTVQNKNSIDKIGKVYLLCCVWN